MFGFFSDHLPLATYRVSQIPSDITREQIPRFLSSCEALQGSDKAYPSDNVLVHSLASFAGQRKSTKTATVSFQEAPPRLLKNSQWSIPFNHNGRDGSIVLDTQFEGFTVMNEINAEDHVLE